ncbi:division/cell wall cluster transcriptional repressor MraZ [Methyloglobulus sp.]|uniref:division/cell wall cluster transcriptional repressor MraZ n=1 Tax=Methyloglobulus sp. TaxID=2518622 RepID=UPI0039894B9E
MFRGTTTVNLDEKSRFAIPSRFRDRVREICACQFIATVAVDHEFAGIPGCLWIYPKPEYEKLEKEIVELTSSEESIFLRTFISGFASECEMDTQGRVLIPESLRTIANLDKKIVLVGQINRFDVWSEEEWGKKQAQFFNGPSVKKSGESIKLSF